MDLLELKRYAIENRVDIRINDPRTNRECLINSRGLVKILVENKDLRVEDLLDAAETFEIVVNGISSQRHNREAMNRIIAEAFARNRSGHHQEEEE
ncbi:MAG: hypothetical protein J2P41_17090 [Blastocatellia bacterium]|nr:hypothetical protein [Blastocatellia bacterium]